MKLSELRPCDGCGGPIAPLFHVLTYTPAVIDATPANQVLGLLQYFGGKAIGLAEVMAPAADEAVKLGSDKHPDMKVTLFLCTDCYVRKSVGEVMESIAEKADKT